MLACNLSDIFFDVWPNDRWLSIVYGLKDGGFESLLVFSQKIEDLTIFFIVFHRTEGEEVKTALSGPDRPPFAKIGHVGVYFAKMGCKIEAEVKSSVWGLNWIIYTFAVKRKSRQNSSWLYIKLPTKKVIIGLFNLLDGQGIPRLGNCRSYILHHILPHCNRRHNILQYILLQYIVLYIILLYLYNTCCLPENHSYIVWNCI